MIIKDEEIIELTERLQRMSDPEMVEQYTVEQYRVACEESADMFEVLLDWLKRVPH